jgi:peptide/nickel transport system permease protein
VRLARYVVRRVLLLPVLLAGVSVLAFILSHLVPGDPTVAFLGERAAGDPAVVAAFRHEWGLDRPLPMQYLIYLEGLLRGDMGRSLTTQRPVTVDLRERFPATVELAIGAMIFSVLVGIPLGVVAAVHRRGVAAEAARIISVLGVSTPVFWLGLMAIIVFYAELGWAPAPGPLSLELTPPPLVTGLLIPDALLAGQFGVALNALEHLALPAIVLSTYSLGSLTRLMRSTMIETLTEDYVRTARAKGLPQRMVVVRHAVRNAFIPVLTVMGLNFGNLLAGAVVTETVFSWPGLGQYAFEAASSLDFAAIMGVGMLIALAYLVMSLLVDVSYAVIDPRIRIG